ncbi:hypothetical protein WMF26_21620 [Sorangium sp. So ce185]|uniref:hypothetical protein n=1 Tax=Sorangium sp. So ce185 TaxID=3133287 RepID=UPI003F619157
MTIYLETLVCEPFGASLASARDEAVRGMPYVASRRACLRFVPLTADIGFSAIAEWVLAAEAFVSYAAPIASAARSLARPVRRARWLQIWRLQDLDFTRLSALVVPFIRTRSHTASGRRSNDHSGEQDG